MNNARNATSPIEGFAWDATVGCGNDAELPTVDDFAALARRMGRQLTSAEMRRFTAAWERCHQEMCNP
jgi:hypothetical protein